VLVSGSVADKPARLVAAGEPVELLSPPMKYVGRGALKLVGALDRFGLVVSGLRGLDAGASTGGFTDVLLQNGARAVVAVDVGYGQLHERLRADERVDNRERTNVRELSPDAIDGPVDIVVADLSFISLRVVAPALTNLLRPGGELVMLIKPQFEAGRQEASKGRGIIREPEIWRRVIGEVQASYNALGIDMMDLMVSPLRGADGNREFLVHGRSSHDESAADPGRGGSGTPSTTPGAAIGDEVIAAVVTEAGRP